MVINIGAAKSFKTPDSWDSTPDDRQEKIEIVGGVHVEDLGVVDAGETVTCQAIFDASNWETIKGYWTDRTMVSVTDPAGNALGSRRVVVKGFGYTGIKKKPKFYNVKLELWRV